MNQILLLPIIFILLLTPALSQNKTEKQSNSKILITMETHAYFSVLNYSLQIYSDGTVICDAQDGFVFKGKRRYKISTDKVKELVLEFQRINYFSLEDSYETTISDAGFTETSISIDGKQKKIVNAAGPKELFELENKIYETAGVKDLLSIKNRLDGLFSALNQNPPPKGLIINYGDSRKILKREANIKAVIRFRRYDISQVKFIRKIRKQGIRTVFRMISGENSLDF